MADENPDASTPAGRPARPAYQAPRITPPKLPGIGTLFLWGGIGCLVFVIIFGGLAAVGVGLFVTIAKNYQPGPADVEPIDWKPGDALPEPPLQLPMPPAPTARLGETELSHVAPRELAAAAQHLYEMRRYDDAVRCQYQVVSKSDAGRYNLACYYARAGDMPAALYWLQAGARDEGADADWALQDDDLAGIRKDSRWPKLLRYLRVCQRYWETGNFSETTLVLPHGTLAGRPIAVFIGLHGLGDTAHGFIDPDEYQPLADEMGVAFLGVSGTIPHGKSWFTWSEDPVKDLERIDAALREVSDRLTPAEGQEFLLGFSQGGRVAAELAARRPDRFAGAIVLSPGSRSGERLPSVDAGPLHRRQGIVAVCGAGEHPRTIEYTNRCAALFKKLGARVFLKLYPGMNRHSLPPDYRKKLPDWGKFILNPDASPPTP